MHFTSSTILLSLASLAAAKTDYDGCTSFTSIVTAADGNPGNAYATVIYYVPDSLEICHYVDCGGGRAPPKTTQPGCPGYEGTETLLPSYLKYDPADIRETGATPTTATASATATAEAEDDEDSGAETGTGMTTVVTPTGSAGADEEETGSESSSTAEETFAVPTFASGGSDNSTDADTVGENAAARNGFAFAIPAVLGSLVVAVMA